MFTLTVTLGERALLNNKIKKYDILASALFFLLLLCRFIGPSPHFLSIFLSAGG